MTKAFLCLVTLGVLGANAAQVSPVQKVIQLIADMETKVTAEGNAAEADFAEYAKWCDGEADEKTRLPNTSSWLTRRPYHYSFCEFTELRFFLAHFAYAGRLSARLGEYSFYDFLYQLIDEFLDIVLQELRLWYAAGCCDWGPRSLPPYDRYRILAGHLCLTRKAFCFSSTNFSTIPRLNSTGLVRGVMW